MITLNSPLREFKPAPASITCTSDGSGFSEWFIESPRRRSDAASQPRAGDQSTPATTGISDHDLLIADIADLARAYLAASTTSSFDVAASADGAGLPSRGEGEDDALGLLDAVRGLLDSAIQKMRAASLASIDRAMPATPSRPRGGIAPSALRRVRAHIDQNLAEHIEIADLATLTGLSPCHFSRAFKQSMGVPPHRYLISRRVEEAARLIESTDKPLYEIALDVGFSDQSHFTRVFSSQVGESPNQFRHQRR